jgi:hypothetical protein
MTSAYGDEGVVPEQAVPSHERVSIKVFIGVASQNSVHVQFAFAFARMVKETQHTIAWTCARGSNICMNRNVLVRAAKDAKAEFLLFIDNDLSFPPFSLNRMVEIAEKQNLDILGCNYLFHTPPHISMAIPKGCKEQSVTDLDEVDRLPTGMMLIRMSVLDKIEEPYFIYPSIVDDKGLITVSTEDYYFCDKARDAGVPIWMDSALSFGLVHWDGSIGVQWTPQPPGYRYVTEALAYSE